MPATSVSLRRKMRHKGERVLGRRGMGLRFIVATLQMQHERPRFCRFFLVRIRPLGT